MVQTILECGLVAAIILAVGGFGGTEPISWGIAEVVVLSLGLLLAASPRPAARASFTKLHWLPVALVAWVAIQWFFSRFGKIGFDTHAIESQGLVFVTAIVAFYVALEVSSKLETRKRLVLFLLGVGLFEACYGLLQYLAGWQYIWNVPRRFYIGSATGTYINHNHFAGFLEMILPLALALALHHFQRSWRDLRIRSARELINRLGHPEMLKGVLLLLAATILFLAILFSLSRMGMISMLASLFVMGIVACAGNFRSRLPAALVLLLILGGASAAAWVGVTPVVQHFEQLPGNEPMAQGGEGRAALWKDTINLIGEHPWTGVGLGSFEYAFTRVQSIRLTFVADHAHEDFLELTAELGIPAAVLLISVLLWLCGGILRASVRARPGLARALALGSLGGASALLFHGLADFNFYIPANALVFAVLLGTGYAATRDPARPSEDAQATERWRGARYSFEEEPEPVEAGVAVRVVRLN